MQVSTSDNQDINVGTKINAFVYNTLAQWYNEDAKVGTHAAVTQRRGFTFAELRCGAPCQQPRAVPVCSQACRALARLSACSKCVPDVLADEAGAVVPTG